MKKIKRNKYDHIKATFRTRPYKPEKNHDKALFKKKNELFKRLYLRGLNLLVECDLNINYEKFNDNILNDIENYETSYKIKLDNFKDILNYYNDYIIIDTRDEYDYNSCKIKGSISCPSFLFRLNKIPDIIKEYNKKKDKLIFFYHQNDKYSEQTADIMYERGINNIIMIDGGIDLLITKKSILIEKNNNHNIIPSNSTIRHQMIFKKHTTYEKPNEILMNSNTFSIIQNKKFIKKRNNKLTDKPNNFDPTIYINK